MKDYLPFLSPATKRTLRYVMRGAIMYLCYRCILSLVSTLLYADRIGLPGMGEYSSASLSADLGLPFNVAHLLLILIVPFLFYSVTRVFMLGDARGYAEAEELEREDRPVRLGDVIALPAFRAVGLTVLLLYVLFPLSFGYGDLVAWPDFASVLGRATEKVLFAIPTVPLYAIVLMLATRSARREWQRTRAERAAAPLDEKGGCIGFFKDKTGLGGLLGGLFLIAWLYPIGSMAFSVLAAAFLMPFLVAMFSTPEVALVSITVLIGLAAAVALIFAGPSYIRALFKRRRLIRGLRRVCRECGYELSPIRQPYWGLIRHKAGADFSVKVGDKQYDCRLLSAVLPGGKMLFDYEGSVTVHHYIRFFWAAQRMHVATQHTFEQSTFSSTAEYAFDSDHQKLLIVCPTAPQTLIVGPKGGTPLDTGAHIGEYRMFNTTGFLGALERDCLDR
ncbi:MAG: hypothetical protein J6R04_02675 [Clostridia bacterium]|nr:hypothetical protein [Clostridia bacterium]